MKRVTVVLGLILLGLGLLGLTARAEAQVSSGAVATGAGYTTPTRKFFARLATYPSQPNSAAYNTFIKGLVNGGVWTNLDALYLFAAVDSPTGLTNLEQTGSATKSGSPTFLAYGGFTPASTTDYIDSGINPSTSGGNYSQNSATMFGWRNVAGTAGNMISLGALGGAYVQATIGASLSVHVNSVSLSQSENLPLTTGLYASSRTSSTAAPGYMNGVFLATTSTASAAVGSATFVGMNFKGDAFAMTGQEAELGFGGALTGAQHRVLYNYSKFYLTAVAGSSTIGMPGFSSDIASGNATGFSYGTGVARLADGRLIAVYSVGTALNTSSVLYYQLSSNSGVSWGAPVTLETPASGFTYTEANVMVTASGTIIVNASYFQAGGPAPSTSVLILGTVGSPLGAISWGSVYTLPSALTVPISDGQAVSLSNGSLMIPIYNDTGASPSAEVTVLFSANGGTTWGNETLVVETSVTGNNDQWGESGFAVLPNGTVFGIIRNDNSVTASRQGWWTVTSTNNGATWSSPTMILAANTAVSRPGLAVDPYGNLFAVGRFNVTSPGTQGGVTAYSYSTDGAGVTWSTPQSLYSVDSADVGYAGHGYCGGFWDSATQSFIYSINYTSGYTLFQQFGAI